MREVQVRKEEIKNELEELNKKWIYREKQRNK
jgi:hypothetical protein